MIQLNTEPVLLSVKQAAALSGLSYSTIRRLLDAGKITPRRPTPGGWRVMIGREELVRYLLSDKPRRRKRKDS